MSILKFATAGSVDHGKSTLLGRILYDLDQLKDDQIEALHADGSLNLAFATDGLSAERSQGITIDVAYRYFSIEGRRYVSVDAPGHEEYTRNAFTAFTQVSSVILVVDVLRKDYEQLFSHLALCAILQIPNICIAINKMDTVGFSESQFNGKVAELQNHSRWIPFETISIVPVSALEGDNVITHSPKMPWYEGASIFDFLKNCQELLLPEVLHIQTEENGLYFGTYYGAIPKDGIVLEEYQVQKVNGKSALGKLPLDSGAWEVGFTSSKIAKLDTLVGMDIINSNSVKARIFNVDMDSLTSNMPHLAIQTIAGLFPIELFEIEGGICASNKIGQVTITTTAPFDSAKYEFGQIAGRFTIVNTALNNIVAGGIFV